MILTQFSSLPRETERKGHHQVHQVRILSDCGVFASHTGRGCNISGRKVDSGSAVHASCGDSL